jgi:hypothetical protein
MEPGDLCEAVSGKERHKVRIERNGNELLASFIEHPRAAFPWPVATLESLGWKFTPIRSSSTTQQRSR